MYACSIYKLKKVILVEPNENRIFAKNIPTINSFVNPKKCDPVDKIMKLTNAGRKFDIYCPRY